MGALDWDGGDACLEWVEGAAVILKRGGSAQNTEMQSPVFTVPPPPPRAQVHCETARAARGTPVWLANPLE